jgi:Ras-related protein Rab-2A
VSYDEGEKFANVNGFMFFETSAQTGEKVDELFQSVAKKIITKIESNELNPDSESVLRLLRSCRASEGGKSRSKRLSKQHSSSLHLSSKAEVRLSSAALRDNCKTEFVIFSNC